MNIGLIPNGYLRLFLLSTVFAFLSVTVMVAHPQAGENKSLQENLEKLKTTNKCKGCDLSGLNLSRLDLTEADLEGANLASAKLSLANLSRANLKNANLRGAVLGGTDLSSADLRGADLRGTSLDSAYHQGAQFDGEFIAAKSEESDVPESGKEVYVADSAKPKLKPETREVSVASQSDAKKPLPSMAPVQVVKNESKVEASKSAPTDRAVPSVTSSVPAPSAKKVVPVQQAIVDVPNDDNIKNSNKKKTADKKNEDNAAGETVVKSPQDDEKAANLARLFDKNKCYACDLSGSNLAGKNLDGADLEKANLTGCNFEKADLDDANLKGALLQKANLRQASLKNADFYKANLEGADFTGAKADGAMFDNAQTASAVGLAEILKDIKK